MKQIILVVLVFSQSLLAQKRYSYPTARGSGVATSSGSSVTYDVSASFGNYNNATYNEINLGLNWLLSDYLNWRNSLFNRFGENITSVSGLDSSLRLQTTVSSDEETFGLHAFLGPGVRLASDNWNAYFGEAGLVFKLGGLKIGAGIKAMTYVDHRKDKSNKELPQNDQQVFLILSGGGIL